MLYKKLIKPKITWLEDGRPFNTDSGDCYFSQNPEKESQYVFLDGNQLKARWKNITVPYFSILEMGFGIGLNFIKTLELWHHCNQRNCKLVYYSIERSPLNYADLVKCFSLFPHLNYYTDLLLKKLPAQIPGKHLVRFKVDGLEVDLVLIYLEAKQAIDEFVDNPTLKLNAIYFDGFSPKNNKSMWTFDLFTKIIKISNSDCTFSTYSSAGNVKRALQTAGYIVKKMKGFEKKREMLTGYIDFRKNHVIPTKSIHLNNKVLVIGAGLAGCITASKLAQRGYFVDLVDKNNEICEGASGNATGLVYPKMSNVFNSSCSLLLNGFYFLLNELECYPEVIKNLPGIIQLYGSDLISRINENTSEKLGIDKSFIENISRLQIANEYQLKSKYNGYFLKSAGWINPKNLCGNYLQDGLKNQHIKITTNCSIKLNKNTFRAFKSSVNFKSNEFILTDNSQEYAHIIICTGNGSNQLTPSLNKFFKPIAGQIDKFKLVHPFKYPICYDGYIIPTTDDEIWVGASFEPNIDTLEWSRDASSENLLRLKLFLPEVKFEDIVKSRRSVRMTSIDRLPMVGKLLQHSLTGCALTDKNNQSNIYLNTAHGSHGLLSIPLCSEFLVRQICQEPLPISQKLAECIDPNRFINKI